MSRHKWVFWFGDELYWKCEVPFSGGCIDFYVVLKACGWEHDQNQACTSLWPRVLLFFFGNALALGLYPTLVGLEPSAWLKSRRALQDIVAHCRTIHVCGFINLEIYVHPVSLQNPKSSNATMVDLQNQFVGGFGWCGITAFVQSWRVTGHICPVLGQPDGYSAATMIVTRGSNQAVGILMC